jgi:hypothetical protein
VEQQGKGRKGRDRKRTPKNQRKSPPEILGEMGTADAQDVNVEAPDKSDRGEQQGKGQGKGKRDSAKQRRIARKDKVGYKPMRKQLKNSSGVKRRVIDSEESQSDYDPEETSDDSDDEKKARTDAKKPKDGDKKRGNEAIDGLDNRRGQEKEPERRTKE